MTTIYPNWLVYPTTWFFLFAAAYLGFCWAFPPADGYAPGRLTAKILLTGTVAVQAAAFGAAMRAGRLPRPPRVGAWRGLSLGLTAAAFCLWVGGVWFLLVPGAAP